MCVCALERGGGGWWDLGSEQVERPVDHVEDEEHDWKDDARNDVDEKSFLDLSITHRRLRSKLFRKAISNNGSNNRNRKLEISTAPIKAKSREPTYSQALVQDKIDRQRVRSRESGK